MPRGFRSVGTTGLNTTVARKPANASHCPESRTQYSSFKKHQEQNPPSEKREWNRGSSRVFGIKNSTRRDKVNSGAKNPEST
jgi:hypothetical protein